jgi:hypothetical protein
MTDTMFAGSRLEGVPAPWWVTTLWAVVVAVAFSSLLVHLLQLG